MPLAQHDQMFSSREHQSEIRCSLCHLISLCGRDRSLEAENEAHSRRLTLPLPALDLLLLPGLDLHLLHLDRVGLAAAHVQLMVAHAQVQDPLVDAQSRRIEHKVLKQ